MLKAELTSHKSILVAIMVVITALIFLSSGGLIALAYGDNGHVQENLPLILVWLAVIGLNSGIRAYILERWAFGIANRLRLKTLKTILTTHASNRHNISSAKLNSLYSKDINLIEKALNGTLPSLLRNTVMLITALISMLSINFTLTSYVGGLLLAVIIPLWLLFKIRARIIESYKQGFDSSQDVLNEQWQNQPTARKFGEAARVFSYNLYAEQATNNRQNKSHFALIRGIFGTYIIMAIIAAIMVIAAIKQDMLAAGEFSELESNIYLYSLIIVAFCLSGYGTIINNFARARKSYQELEATLTKLADNNTTPQAQPQETRDFKISIPEFSYPNQAQPALQNIKIDIQSSEYYHLIAPNGGGKSTLLKLIAGVIPSQHQVANPQAIYLSADEVYIYTASIADNIILGRNNLTQKHITQLLESINIKPNFFPELSSSASKLSMGQKSLISLLRVLIINKPEDQNRPFNLLLVDELLSNLDSDTRNKIRQYLRTKKYTVLEACHQEVPEAKQITL